MAEAAILKSRKIAISQPRLERFERNLAWWCSSTLLTVPTVKNLKCWKSKMAAAAILKIRKITIYQSRFERFWRNLAWWCRSSLLTVPSVLITKTGRRRQHITPVLRELHWFSIRKRINFKLAVLLLVYKGITRPAYTVPGWRLSALDRHRPPITAIGWCLDVCHCAVRRTRTRLVDFWRHLFV